MRYFHGGISGLKVGGFILPPITTKARTTANYGNYNCDRTQVYITTNFTAACMYAAFIPGGEVYEVKPIGKISNDTDCTEPGLSYSCPKAKIIKRCRKLRRDEVQTIRKVVGFKGGQ